MIGKWLTLLAMTGCLLAPVAAKADPTVTERFTNSMVTVYVAAERCKHVPTLHSENYTVVIKGYMTSYFQSDIPYWVLPEVNEQMNNRENCIFSIEQGIAHYQTDSREYAALYPERPVPPVLDDAMMNDDRSYAIVPSQPQSNGEHYLTPTILIRPSAP